MKKGQIIKEESNVCTLSILLDDEGKRNYRPCRSLQINCDCTILLFSLF